VKKPPDVDGELLCFRAGQQHAKLSACRNRDWLIHLFFSTSSVCMIAIWPVGPPKEITRVSAKIETLRQTTAHDVDLPRGSRRAKANLAARS
jgi:hypothetical protein